jgi:acetoin utilization deacetylase AcuC-like enzyme
LGDKELAEQLPGIIENLIDGVDVLFYQAGADPHIDDPYGGYLTTEALRLRDEIVFSIAAKRGVPVVWNLAGGYQSPIEKVLEIHDNTARMHLQFLGLQHTSIAQR